MDQEQHKSLARLHRFTIILFAAIAGIDVLAFLLAPVPGFAEPGRFRGLLVITGTIALNYFATGLLFLRAVRGFKPEMRRSYRLIAISMGCLGLINLQYPVLIYFNQVPGPWFWSGASIAVAVPCVIVLWTGARKFAEVLGIQTWFASLRWVLLALATVPAVVLLLPHRFEAGTWYYTHQIAMTVEMMWNVFVCGTVFAILRNIGPSYMVAIRWWAAATVGSVLGLAQMIIVRMAFGYDNFYNNQGLTGVPFMMTGLFLAIAGYQFCKVRFYGIGTKVEEGSGRPVLDAVIALAGLVSRRSEIEDIVTQVRNITAALSSDKPMTESDRRVLIEIYLNLEDYLVQRERLRTFTREGLRARLSAEALAMLPKGAESRV